MNTETLTSGILILGCMSAIGWIGLNSYFMYVILKHRDHLK